MKAVIQTGYGSPRDVLEVRDIDKPTIGPNQVLVRVRATSVHADVWHVVSGFPFVLRLMGSGLRRPTALVPGTDLAGIVEEVGKDVRRLNVGDEVFGESLMGMQWQNAGAFAEYVAAPEEGLVLKPDNVSFEQAAAVPTAGYIVLINLRGRAAIQSGQHVLINGAAGGVGSIALQIAKARGATVTAVDHTDKLDLLRQLGADEVIDYTREDCTLGEPRYDLVFDVASTLKLSHSERVLKPDGVVVVIGHDHYGSVGRRIFGSIPLMVGLMARSIFDRHLDRPDTSMPDKQQSMNELRDLLASGQLTPVIDRTYPLEQVGEAMQRLQDGRGLGRILLTP
ncbi:NAD(P)-dependent alcohol dehydrogenase [Haliangium sp.]|uniref:NAD(P)-dependent alcohol dehydrogenase n=1 Tax=Haliangium sp. TaxID=2663208 RepID=UPI003D11CBBE